MDAELLSRGRTQDIEREISRIRLAAAAESARSEHRGAASDGKPRAVPAMPLRILRALRQSA
jgi:hypothetical protein